MNILINGVDVTASVQPNVLQVSDYAGGRPDDMQIVFADPDGLWSKWQPAKNDTLQVRDHTFDSGVMYVDQIGQRPGRFELKALSIPQAAKTSRSQAWENVRFLELAVQVAARYGMEVHTGQVANHLYARVDQQEEPDFAFLRQRCLLEGYMLKITNNALVIQNEAGEGAQTEVTVIRLSDIIGDYDFADKSTDIFGASQVIDGPIKGSFVAPDVTGSTLRDFRHVSSQAEADRWAKGLLRAANKYRVAGKMTLTLRPGLAAGSVVRVQDVGYFDGLFIIDRIVHDWMANQSRLTIRKVLEGYA